MSPKSYTLFRPWGLDIKVHPSWFFLALLIIWSLATGYFPVLYQLSPSIIYWYMGIACTLGIFLSIVLHEMSHALVARRSGLAIKGINLFILGGVADLAEEPQAPGTEFWMAIAGPLASLGLAGLFFALFIWSRALALPLYAQGVLEYLGKINIVLAIFNLLPAFPLDGGRMLRALLWKVKKDLPWATRKAVQVASFLTAVMIVIGFLVVLRGKVLDGLWTIILAIFIRTVSRGSEYEMILQQHLKGEPLHRVLNENPATVHPYMKISEVISDYFIRYHKKFFPVVENGELLGQITHKDIRNISKEKRGSVPTAQVLEKRSEDNTIPENQDLLEAFRKMKQTGQMQLMVVEKGNRLKGTISLGDIREFLSIKLEMENISRPQYFG